MPPALTLSELITILSNLRELHGDLPVTYWDCGDDSEMPLMASDIAIDQLPEPHVRLP